MLHSLPNLQTVVIHYLHLSLKGLTSYPNVSTKHHFPVRRWTADEPFSDTVDLPTNKTFPYATTDDPVIKQNTYQYSRRLEDLSTYLITFNSPLSTPFICLTGAAEHELNCIRYLNPNDLSETFARRMDTNNDLLSDQTNAGDRAQELIIKGAVGSHKEVIHMLREAFEQDERLGLDDPDQRLFGRVTYLWQEIVNRVEDNGMYDGSFDRSFWPGGG